ncbi:hypothetical protein ACOMHN_050315 [Nucella lapillus]
MLSQREVTGNGQFDSSVARGHSGHTGPRDSSSGVDTESRDASSASVMTTGHEEGPYADVTFPPYVERLPAGARGNGPEGLRVSSGGLSPQQQALLEVQWKTHHFNQYASDRIPVHRPLPDYRSKRSVLIRGPAGVGVV